MKTTFRIHGNPRATALLGAGLLAAAASCATPALREGETPRWTGETAAPAEAGEETVEVQAAAAPETPAVEPVPVPVPVATETADAAPAASTEAPAEETSEAKALPASFVRTQEERAAEAPDLPDTSAMELAFFNTNEFRREFARSWLSRTDIEPTVDPEELEDLQEVVELLSEGETARAKEKLQRAQRRKDTPNVAFMLGMLQFQDTEYGPAIEQFDAAIKSHANFLRAIQFRALSYFALAATPPEELEGEALERYKEFNYAEAGKGFRQQLALGGISGQTYGLLGSVLLTQQRFLEAETAFRNALLFEPEKSQWRTSLVSTLLQQGRFADASSLLDTMIAENPDGAELWKMQGSAYAGLKELDRAAENLFIAEQLGGADASSIYLLADIYTNQGHYGLAADAYLRAVAAGEGADVRRALKGAEQILRLGDIDAADTVARGLDASAGETLEAEQRARLRKLQSQVAVRRGDAEGEIEILRTILDENPLDGEAMTLLAAALGKQGQTAEAFQLFETAANIDGATAQATLEHARLLVREGDYQAAVPLLKASLNAEDSESVRRYMEEVEKAAKRAR